MNGVLLASQQTQRVKTLDQGHKQLLIRNTLFISDS